MNYNDVKIVYGSNLDVSNHKLTPISPTSDHDIIHYSNEDIFAIVDEIQNSALNETERDILYTEKYPQFVNQFPILFHVICRENFDRAKLNYMMGLRSQIQMKKRTVEDSSAEVGRKFYETYVENKNVKFE